MEEEDRLPLRRVEHSLTKFNEVAIPHHLDLLRQHRANMIKFEQSGQWALVRAEQARAGRAAQQLRALLGQMEALRGRVRDEDRPRFDHLTSRSRDLTLRAVVDYLETSPLSANRVGPELAMVVGSVGSTDSVGVLAVGDAGEPLLQLQVDDQEVLLREREAVLGGWTCLQEDVRALHEAWSHVQRAADAQRAHVERVQAAAEEAVDHVAAARDHLAAGERLRAGAWGAGGAAVGALCLGPVGLVVGAKAGAAALLAGSALGYAAARLLGARRIRQLDQPAQDETHPHEE